MIKNSLCDLYQFLSKKSDSTESLLENYSNGFLLKAYSQAKQKNKDINR